jgi:nitronate monooxygenase
MAGGATTVDLVVAVAAAGAFGWLAGGYLGAGVLADQMAAVRAAGVGTFGVNVFVPGAPTEDPEGLAAYLDALGAEAAALGTPLGAPTWDDDDYPAKIEVLLAAPPAATGFTFGLPAPAVVRALQDAGSLVLITVTTPEEAMCALALGPDALSLQGAEAGAHRGSLANEDRADADRPLYALLAAVRRRTLVPLVAAGGVGGPGDVTDLLARGATLVQCGTAFLRCPESGVHQLYKDALGAAAAADSGLATDSGRAADPEGAVTAGRAVTVVTAGTAGTAVTRAFSGRRARAVANAMVRDHPRAPAAYPEVNNTTRPLRAAAAAAGDAGHMSLYAGVGFAQAEARPAAQIVEHLVSGLRR